MKRLISFVATAVVCLGASGCALTNLAPAQPPATFDLVAPDSGSASGKTRDLQLVVNPPSAVRALASDRIMVKTAVEAVAYYPNAAWTDQLTTLLQVRLIETLERSNRFRAVSDGRDRIEADLILLSSVRAFQVEAPEGATAIARVSLFAKLIDQRSGRLVASKGFDAEAPAPAASTEAGVGALNEAMRIVLLSVSKWAGSVRYERPEAGLRYGAAEPAPAPDGAARPKLAAASEPL